jgi:hypothetical protein
VTDIAWVAEFVTEKGNVGVGADKECGEEGRAITDSGLGGDNLPSKSIAQGLGKLEDLITEDIVA